MEPEPGSTQTGGWGECGWCGGEIPLARESRFCSDGCAGEWGANRRWQVWLRRHEVEQWQRYGEDIYGASNIE